MNYSTNLSGLLAIMILLCVSLACSDAGAESSDTTAKNDNQKASSTASSEFKIDKAEMRKDDAGEMSDETATEFTRDDKQIHFFVNWDNPKAGMKIKLAYVAVDAGGAKNHTIKEFNLTTENELQNEAYGKLKPTKPPPAGSYKVDVYVNDKLERSVPFTIS